MSYRVELERFGAVVTVETVQEVRDLLEAIYPRIEITAGPSGNLNLADLAREAAPSSLPTTKVTRARREVSGPRPSQAKVRDRTLVTIDPKVERGLIALVRDEPRSGAELARASGIGQTTVARYMRTLEAAGKVHLEGAGRAAKWVLGPKEEV